MLAYLHKSSTTKFQLELQSQRNIPTMLENAIKLRYASLKTVENATINFTELLNNDKI